MGTLVVSIALIVPFMLACMVLAFLAPSREVRNKRERDICHQLGYTRYRHELANGDFSMYPTSNVDAVDL